ncbi:MAG TPA: hypothetical protein VF690_01350 [Hymenobacter sp.]
MRFSWLALLPLLAACNSTPSAVHEGTVSRIADRAPTDSTAPAGPDPVQAKARSAARDTLRVVR